MKIAICIPILNAAETAHLFIGALQRQSFADLEKLVIDSESTDGCVHIFSAAGFKVHSIPCGSFNHGKARQLGTELLSGAELIIFMTQDAILAGPHSVRQLIAAFDDPHVGAAYGCQLPREDAKLVAAHARIFNYPVKSHVRSKMDISRYGIKSAFISNSFAAYRWSALEAIGGFPTRCIVSEDTYVAARMLLAGWKVAYCAEAQVYHSHSYNWRQEFQRYFDIGVFHAREPWIRGKFGGAEGEGGRFLRSEMKYLARHAPHLIPSALVRTVVKYLGFRAGLVEKHLPLQVKRRMSMQKAFWNAEQGDSQCSGNKQNSSNV